MKEQDKINRTIAMYHGRQSRLEHPDGEFDDKSRWYPSEHEHQSCCDKIRTPSRRWPHSLNKHCRSFEHICNLFGLTDRQKRIAKSMITPEREPLPRYVRFKQVAVIDGEYRSIFSGRRKYQIGRTYTQKAQKDHNGGWYVYKHIEAAEEAEFPRCSVNLDAMYRAILKCEVWGNCVDYGNKQAWTYLKPLEVVSEFQPQVL